MIEKKIEMLALEYDYIVSLLVIGVCGSGSGCGCGCSCGCGCGCGCVCVVRIRREKYLKPQLLSDLKIRNLFFLSCFFLFSPSQGVVGGFVLFLGE